MITETVYHVVQYTFSSRRSSGLTALRQSINNRIVGERVGFEILISSSVLSFHLIKQQISSRSRTTKSTLSISINHSSVSECIRFQTRKSTCMKPIHCDKHLFSLCGGTPLLTLRPSINDSVEDVGVRTQIGMTNLIRLMQRHHVRKQRISTSGGVALHTLCKCINNGTVGDNIRFDTKITLIIHHVHTLEEVLCFLSGTLSSRFGIGIDDNIVRNCVWFHRRVPFTIHLVHVVQNPVRLGCRFLRSALCICMNDSVEGIFVRTNIQVLSASITKLFHPRQNLFRPGGGNLLTTARPCIDNSVENSSGWLQCLVASSTFAIQTIHPLQKSFSPTSSGSTAITFSPCIDCHSVHTGSWVNTVRVFRIVLRMHAIQPHLNHTRSLARLLLCPAIHDSREW
mmetsp:Transcript_15862/g.26029  ORF Transcript_15862/g.26029 Transcript_15862/m.26029 type:complete len:398 (-) Transcript_15862:1306-2499(-)